MLEPPPCHLFQYLHLFNISSLTSNSASITFIKVSTVSLKYLPSLSFIGAPPCLIDLLTPLLKTFSAWKSGMVRTGSWTSISAWNSGMVRTGSWTSISAWNSGIGRAPGLQFQPGSLKWNRFLDFNFGLELWNGTGSWTSISAWNSGIGRAPGLQFQPGSLKWNRFLDFNFGLELWNGTGSWTSISAWNSGIGRAPGLQFQPGSLKWNRFLDFNFGLELWNGTGSWTSILAWNSGMDSSGLQNQNWRSLELAKEWGLSGLWNWRRMGDFRISETNTYEFLLEILADYTIRRFSVFDLGLQNNTVQVFLSAWELRNDDLQSGSSVFGLRTLKK
ncbi:unnamed protein product [Rhizophagus irregularis]|nr:unnamed protein product [Rhizophagus irregularis]